MKVTLKPYKAPENFSIFSPKFKIFQNLNDLTCVYRIEYFQVNLLIITIIGLSFKFKVEEIGINDNNKPK